MRVILAGFNVDTEVLQQATGIDRDQLTPETLSAAYARISRNPAPVNELRRKARAEVARARASNEQIIFGLGHASVAEHAVFNFDLIGLSRLAIEAVEHSRLCSYTEKSQRYIRLRNDFVLPDELVAAGLADRFQELVLLQNRTYHLLYEKLREYVFSTNPELARDKAHRHTLDGWAKEDARYVTSMATEGQLGMTLNARNLESMIRRLARHPLAEVRQVAALLHEQGSAVAPSLIRYTDTSPALQAGEEQLAAVAAAALGEEDARTLPGATGAVHLVDHVEGGDDRVIAGLLHGASAAPWTSCMERVRAMGPEQRARVLHAVLRPLSVHDAPPRAFELSRLGFDLVLSAACFGQLKRHRMATLVVQPYDPSLGYTMPGAVSAVGMTGEFKRVMAESARLFEEVAPRGAAAAYALTQAHRRRVLMSMNGRELYHFSRLRQDAHAQWDIRKLADRMLHLARRELPLTFMMACGKDRFEAQYAEVFGDLAG